MKREGYFMKKYRLIILLSFNLRKDFLTYY
jgi:hypothetical protein